MPWSLSDSDPKRPLSDEEKQHLADLKSWHTSFEALYAERERLEAEAREAGKGEKPHWARPPAEGCLLSLLLWPLFLIWRHR